MTLPPGRPRLVQAWPRRLPSGETAEHELRYRQAVLLRRRAPPGGPTGTRRESFLGRVGERVVREEGPPPASSGPGPGQWLLFPDRHGSVVQREGGVGAAGGWEAQEEVECCVGGFAVADDEDPLPGVAVENAHESGGGALQVGTPGFAAGRERPVGFEGGDRAEGGYGVCPGAAVGLAVILFPQVFIEGDRYAKHAADDGGAFGGASQG